MKKFLLTAASLFALSVSTLAPTSAAADQLKVRGQVTIHYPDGVVVKGPSCITSIVVRRPGIINPGIAASYAGSISGGEGNRLTNQIVKTCRDYAARQEHKLEVVDPLAAALIEAIGMHEAAKAVRPDNVSVNASALAVSNSTAGAVAK